MVILDLCSGSGSWSQPYLEAGYTVIWIDRIYHQDVRDWRYILSEVEPGDVHGILAAPPCTHFSLAGAHSWKQKDDAGQTAEAIEVVEACLDCVDHFRPTWWALENPVGRLARCVPKLGTPAHRFHPYYYGDPWTKATCLWGVFARPERADVLPSMGSYTNRVRVPQDRARTPEGFARAFFEANR